MTYTTTKIQNIESLIEELKSLQQQGFELQKSYIRNFVIKLEKKEYKTKEQEEIEQRETAVNQVTRASSNIDKIISKKEEKLNNKRNLYSTMKYKSKDLLDSINRNNDRIEVYKKVSSDIQNFLKTMNQDTSYDEIQNHLKKANQLNKIICNNEINSVYTLLKESIVSIVQV